MLHCCNTHYLHMYTYLILHIYTYLTYYTAVIHTSAWISVPHKAERITTVFLFSLLPFVDSWFLSRIQHIESEVRPSELH